MSDPSARRHYSTDDLPADDRLAIWREVYGRKLFNIDIEPFGDGPFRAELAFRAVKNVRVTSGWRSASHYRITREFLPNASDMIGVVALDGGRLLTAERGVDAETVAGGAIAFSTAEVATQTMLGDGHYTCIYVPRSVVAASVRDLDAAIMRPIAARSEALRLLVDYAASVQRADGALEPAIQAVASTHICDLISLVLGASKEATEIAGIRGLRAARLQMLLSAISERFDDLGFCPQDVARKLGVSPRYVQDLLQESGVTFSERVLELRLQRARSLLIARQNNAMKVSDIALASGFGNVSYFNQAFRRRFGCSPTQYRGGEGGA